MKQILTWFSKDYDFNKAAMVGLGFAIVVLALLFTWQYTAFAELDRLVGEGKQVEVEMRQLFQASRELYELSEELKRNDTLTALKFLREYIDKCAFEANLGGLDYDRTKVDTDKKSGYEDRTFNINLRDREGLVTRDQVLRFFWGIEEKTERVRITGFNLLPPSKNAGFVSGVPRLDAWNLKDVKVVARNRLKQ